MSYQRAVRIAEEIRRELSDIIRNHVKDPRINDMVTIMRADVSKDLRHAKVYVSVLGDHNEKQNAMEGIERASGFMRKELGRRLGLRYVPELRFLLDDSVEYSIHIAQRIEELKKKEEDEKRMKSDGLLSVIEILKKGRQFAIVAHVMPDGDTIGSCLALMGVLKENGKYVDLYCQDNPPDNLKFLQGIHEFRKNMNVDAEYDAVICLDCSDEARLGECAGILGNAAHTINIDHHISNSKYADINIVDPGASSTAELIYSLIKKFSNTISLPVCEALYTGIVTDTGGFEFSNTTPAAHRIAAELVEYGVDVDRITRLIYKNIPLEKVRLLGIVLNSLEIYMDGKVAFLTVTRSMYQQAGFTTDNNDSSTEGMINFAIDINGVECAAMFKQIENNITKVGFRTKTEIDASALAARFGGGGHARAAGCTIEDDISSSKNLVLEELKNMYDGKV